MLTYPGQVFKNQLIQLSESMTYNDCLFVNCKFTGTSHSIVFNKCIMQYCFINNAVISSVNFNNCNIIVGINNSSITHVTSDNTIFNFLLLNHLYSDVISLSGKLRSIKIRGTVSHYQLKFYHYGGKYNISIDNSACLRMYTDVSGEQNITLLTRDVTIDKEGTDDRL